MLQFVIAGLVLGGIYAIASAGLVITYTSSGILNFAFGAMAYFIARFYYYLHTQQNWGIAPAAVVSILVAAPAMGVVLYLVLFRFLRLSSPLIKVVATIGLLVAIPSLAIALDLRERRDPAGAGARARTRNAVYQFLGVPINSEPDHRLHLRGRDRGPRRPGPALHRGRAQGPGHGRLAGHDGPVGHQPERDLGRRVGGQHASSPGWSASWPHRSSGSTRPTSRCSIAASLAAVVAAKLRNLPVAVLVGLLMGVATSLIQRYLPSDSQWTTEVDRRHPLHRHRAVLDLQPLPRRADRGDRGVGRCTRPRHHAPGREPARRIDEQRGGDGVARTSWGKYAGPAAPHRRRRRRCPCSSAATGSGCSPQAFAYAVIFLSWTHRHR